ncbi:MAG: peptide deformylase [Actinomycetia bacterium]|nr:peptide deformylase [Actinomycetes bacterium]
MAIKQVRKIGDPVLRETSSEVEKIDRNMLDLVKNMLDTLQDEGGVGLAAPQIGIKKRVIIVRFEDKVQTYVNPEIEVMGNEMNEDDEGCLSIYSIQGFRVKRYSKIKVKAGDLRGRSVEFIAEDLLARIIQHEVDHLNGKLFIDHLDADSKMELLKKIDEITS